MFADFDEKVWCRLARFLNLKDLKVLSLSDKNNNEAVKKFLFETIRIPVVDLQVTQTFVLEILSL